MFFHMQKNAGRFRATEIGQRFLPVLFREVVEDDDQNADQGNVLIDLIQSCFLLSR